jgi:hypothetical protein
VYAKPRKLNKEESVSKRILTEGSTRNKVYRNKGEVPNIPYPPPPPAPQPKSPWIPVSERLPEGSHTYIVSDRKNVSTAFYNKQTGNFVFPDGSYATVTHWMPLPPLPE